MVPEQPALEQLRPAPYFWAMKAFIAAIAFIGLAAVGSAYVLGLYQVSSADKFATLGVRLEAEN